MQTTRIDSMHGLSAGTKDRHLLGISRCQDTQQCSERNLVQWVEQGQLAAAVTSLLVEPLDHAWLLDAIHQHTTILPIQFGAVPFSEDGIRDVLGKQQAMLLQQLERVEGTSEMGLRIELVGDSATAPSPVSRRPAGSFVSPTEYLTQRRTQYERLDQENDRLGRTAKCYVRDLEDLCRDWRRLRALPPGCVRLSFLVDRATIPAFRSRLHALTADKEWHKCKLFGPWPPYSFASSGECTV